jgi:predicted metal-binding membrane protein
MDRTLVESAFRHHRWTLLLVVVFVPLACWIWIVAMARDMYGSMAGASAWMMTSSWDTPHLVLLWAMWSAMMAAMMLPSATPIVLLYAGALRKRPDEPSASAQIWALGAGYVSVWALFSVGATVLQRVLGRRLLLTPMMEPAAPVLAAVLLAAAGLYQLAPVKQACLHWCRSPIAFLGSRWRKGIGGAFRMGVEHGTYCLGCCWALMLLLFAGGVMNLWVILALTVWVAVEKLAPFGKQTARVSAVFLIGGAIWMLVT